jgi:hypothetical protein
MPMRGRGSTWAVAALAGLAVGSRAQVISEVEPNDTKAQATLAVLTSPGATIVGTSTGAAATAGIGSSDYFLLRTAPMPLAIYRHQLVLTSSTPGYTASFRGLDQTAAPQGAWPGPVGTIGTTDMTLQSSTASTTPPQMNQWYGFGKQEEIYYRVEGTSATTAPYTATYSVARVTPVDVGPLAPGMIVITTMGQGHSTDTDMWLYDSGLNAIDGYGNDDESAYNGGTGATLQSILRRPLTAGTYYLALSGYNLANNKASPCDDDYRTGPVLDFPNAVIRSPLVTTVPESVSFAVTDGVERVTPVAATLSGVLDVLWFKLTIGAPTPCYPNCDGSTAAPVLNAIDFTCFLQKFADGDPYANCDGSTAAPVLNVIDFTCFLQKFAAGCSTA